MTYTISLLSKSFFYIITGLYNKVKLCFWGCNFGKHVSIRGNINLHSIGKLVIEDFVRINSGKSNYVGGDMRTSFWVGKGAELRILKGAAISNTTFVCLHSIIIEEDCFIGGGSQIYDTDFHQINAEDRVLGRGSVNGGPIRIGKRCFIGAGSLILKNVTIGEGSVIGAGSIVTKNIPSNQIWAGAPARFIKCIE